MKQNNSGAISVFFALALIIIASLIISTLEAARYSARNSYSKMLLRTASESTLAEFYGPLFADYHLYGIDTGFGTSMRDIDELEKKIDSYIGPNVWNFVSNGCKVTDYDLFMTPGGSTYLNQAYEYEKYNSVGTVVEDILKRINILSDNSETTKIFERTIEVETELAKIDESTIDLMREIDGVNITKAFFTGKYRYKIQDQFVKRLWTGSASELPMNNPVIFGELKDYYINPLPCISDLAGFLPMYITKIKTWKKLKKEKEEILLKLEELKLKREQCEKDYKPVFKALNDLGEALYKLRQVDPDKQDLNAIEALESQIRNLEKELESYRKRIEEFDKEQKELKCRLDEVEEQIEKEDPNKEELLRFLNTRLYLLRIVSDGTKGNLHNVEEILNDIDGKRKDVRPLVKEYEKVLLEDNSLSDDMKKDFVDTLSLMKAYAGISDSSELPVDYDGLSTTVRSDIAVLNLIPDGLFVVTDNTDTDRLQYILDNLSNATMAFNSFSYEDMFFDYSKFKMDAKSFDFQSLFGGWLSKGLMNLILGDAEISNVELKSDTLPTKYYETVLVIENSGLMSDKNGLDGVDLMKQVQGESADLRKIGDMYSSLGDKAFHEIILELYHKDHFKGFTDKGNKGDTVLDYEMEYLVAGSNLDSMNLSNAVIKLLLLRFALASIYAFTSSSVRTDSFTAAMMLVGFTCMPFLVKLVQLVIIAAWAFAQALIETAAILKGKKVSLMTTNKSFCLSLMEVPFTFSLIGEKSDSFVESSIYMEYKEYLMLFLLLQNKEKQAARAMDLIQENIRYKYNDDFLLYNCITGFSVETEFIAEARYKSIFSMLPNVDLFKGYSSKQKESLHY